MSELGMPIAGGETVEQKPVSLVARVITALSARMHRVPETRPAFLDEEPPKIEIPSGLADKLQKVDPKRFNF